MAGRGITDDKKLFENSYYSTQSPGSYSGLSTFKQTLPHHLRDAAGRWLSEQDTYNLHRPVQRKFQRGKIVTGGLDQQFQVDLIDVSRYASHNSGVKFILTVIDFFFALRMG